MNHLIFLGQNHKLAQKELESIFPGLETKEVKSGVLAADLPESDFCRIGGSVKIAQKVAVANIEDLPEVVTSLLVDAKRFGLTFLSTQNNSTQEISHRIKEKLSETTSGARFVLSKDPSGLSPVIIQKQKVSEFFFDPESHILYQTIWTHPFKQWVGRDRHRPYVTPKLGMLPPKLARMMVNIGLNGKDPKKVTLLDPFCGTGTILMEAAIMGVNVIGSDLSKEQVDGTRKNLDWLPDDHFCGQKPNMEVFVSDATHISEILKQKIDVIVTEPFLGRPNPTRTQIANILKGLHKLYQGAFKEWLKILNDNATVVFVYPLFTEDPYTQKQARNFIDTCENLGYNCLVSDLDFTRPGADVYRKILVFQKK